MATLGVYVRIDPEQLEAVRRALDALSGVTTFDLDEAGQLGVILEADDLEAAHAALTGPVHRVPGVLAAWPVYAHFGDDEEEQEEPGPPFAKGPDTLPQGEEHEHADEPEPDPS